MANKAKTSRGGRRPANDDSDRLSRLPDSIISHILSFLPTKFAVATSILSTRWRYIYHDFNSFDFDDPTPLSANINRVTYNDNFMDFVNTILLQSKANSVSKFRLSSLYPIKYPMLNSWISAMLSRDVKVLDLRFPQFVNSQILPNQIFSRKTLVVLKLSGQRIKSPELSFLPNLKVLHLDNVIALAGNGKGWEISAKGYPLLEDLLITTLRFIGLVEYFKIRLMTLIKLTLTNITATGLDVIGFNTPNLHYLECDCHRIGWQSVPYLAKVREVKLHKFKGNESDYEFTQYLLQRGAMLELVSLTAALDGIAKGWPYSVTKKLVKFSRRSKKCELELN